MLKIIKLDEVVGDFVDDSLVLDVVSVDDSVLTEILVISCFSSFSVAINSLYARTLERRTGDSVYCVEVLIPSVSSDTSTGWVTIEEAFENNTVDFRSVGILGNIVLFTDSSMILAEMNY